MQRPPAAVIRTLADAIARRNRPSFYDADPVTVADDDAAALAAMRAAAATDDDYYSLSQFSGMVDRAAELAIDHLVQNPIQPGAAPHAPVGCLAKVRCVAFLLRCLREVYEPWLLRVLQATDFLLGPLRALEAKIPAALNWEEFLHYECVVESMLIDPNCVDIQRICDARDQLVAVQSKLSAVPPTIRHARPLHDTLLLVTRKLGTVNSALADATESMRESPHGALIRFRNESELLVDVASGNFNSYNAVRQLATTLAQQSRWWWAEPDDAGRRRQRHANDGQFATLEERIRAMLAEIDGLIADPNLETDDPRRFRWMAAQVLLAFLLLRVEDALRQREAERRLALAQAFARPRPGQAHAGIAGLGEDLVSSIAALSVNADHDPPGWS